MVRLLRYYRKPWGMVRGGGANDERSSNPMAEIWIVKNFAPRLIIRSFFGFPHSSLEFAVPFPPKMFQRFNHPRPRKAAAPRPLRRRGLPQFGRFRQGRRGDKHPAAYAPPSGAREPSCLVSRPPRQKALR